MIGAAPRDRRHEGRLASPEFGRERFGRSAVRVQLTAQRPAGVGDLRRHEGFGHPGAPSPCGRAAGGNVSSATKS